MIANEEGYVEACERLDVLLTKVYGGSAELDEKEDLEKAIEQYEYDNPFLVTWAEREDEEE